MHLNFGEMNLKLHNQFSQNSQNSQHALCVTTLARKRGSKAPTATFVATYIAEGSISNPLLCWKSRQADSVTCKAVKD